jgi:tyrosinase
MMHHCNLDRIWWTWNQGGGPDSPDPLWSGMTFQNNFFNPDGTPYSPKVSDLLVPEPLGYTYLDTPLQPPVGGDQPPAVVAQYEKYKSLYASPNLATAKPAGIATYAAAVDKPAATVAKYLEIPVDVDAAALAPVATRKSQPSGLESLSLTNARQQYITGARCYAFLRDVDYAQQANTEYRVFLNCDYLSPGTPTTDRHYVGSFGFFGAHSGHGGKSKKPSLGIDLTSTIQRVYGSAGVPPGKLRVQIQPVALRSGGKADGTVKPSSVEVAIVSA